MVGPFGMRPRGTMSVRALPLARALVRRGHQVTMLLPPWQNPEDAGRVEEDNGVRVENAPLPLGLPGWFHARLALNLLRRTLALHPDVVHTFKPKAYAGLVHGGLARLAPRTPVVVDTDDWEGPGGWNDLNPYPVPLKHIFTWQERWGLSHGDAVTVASRALQTLAWATGGPPGRVFYLPNGSDPAPHPPSARNFALIHLGEHRPTLLLYTRFFEFDLERLWRVLQGVRTARPDVRLWVVGKGLFDEEKRLLALAERDGWAIAEEQLPAPPGADLVYAGWVPFDELSAHFAQADVALYPFDDTLINRTKCPVKLVDLLRAGIPVVGEAVGEIAERIHSGQNGVLIPPGDEMAFTTAILELLSDAERRRAMGQRAAEELRSQLGWDHLAGVAESAYRYAIVSKEFPRKPSPSHL